MDSYYKLIYEHSETELFEKIIHFMDISFPQWKTNRDLGFTSVEFIWHCIDFLSLCNLENNDEVFNLRSFNTIYLSLAEDYERFRMEYKSIFFSSVLDKFTAEYSDEIEDEHLTDFRYNQLYNNLLSNKIKRVPYDFRC